MLIKRATIIPIYALLLLSSVAFFGLARADEDAAEGEGAEQPTQTEPEPTEYVDDGQIGPSPDVQSSFLFTNLKRQSESAQVRELVAGQIVKLLVGLANRGEKDLIVKYCETSFRYPMDFSYHIQNFSAVRYERMIQPKEEATFDYAFIPSDSFIGRPLGLVVNLHYVDTDGQYFVSAVFNETITVSEDEASFNTETYFIYLILAALVVVLLLIAQHYLGRFARVGGGGGGKSGSGQKGGGGSSGGSASGGYETGTNKNDVDFEWIPRNHLEKKSPKMGSPRARKPAQQPQQQQATSSSTS